MESLFGIFRRSAVFVALSVVCLVGSGSAVAEPCPTEFNLPPETVCDLTGEICSVGYEEINGSTYCLMQGRLPLGEALEMDDEQGDDPVAGDPNSVRDANLREGDSCVIPTPAVPCENPNLPQIAGATYIDWNDLYVGFRAGGITDTTSLNLFPSTGRPIGTVEDNRIVDFTANQDYNIFATGNCIGDGSALPKQDFTQSYLANNDDYIYFAQERRTENGNSVFYWMLTQDPPQIVTSSNCGSNTRGELVFTLQDQDAQVILNFPSSSDPAAGAVFLRTYSGPTVTLVADEAVFAAGWGFGGPVENFSLLVGPKNNPESDDLIPDWGGFDDQGKAFDQDGSEYYDSATFAEWAVSLDLLFSGQSACGERRFITGVSRSATGQTGDITEPADLKDLVGPKLYSFGEISADATLTPICDPEIEDTDYYFTYSASATDITGLPIDPSDLDCMWTCTSTLCTDPTLSDDGLECSGTGFIARNQGATDAQPCDVSCEVSVQQISSQCTDDTGDADDVLAPILVDIMAAPDTRTCDPPSPFGADPGDIAQGITYDAVASGGDMPYTYVWTVDGPSSACGDAASCNVNFNATDYCARTNLMVTIQDGSICPDADSEPETVTKQTDISGTNQP